MCVPVSVLNVTTEQDILMCVVYKVELGCDVLCVHSHVEIVERALVRTRNPLPFNLGGTNQVHGLRQNQSTLCPSSGFNASYQSANT